MRSTILWGSHRALYHQSNLIKHSGTVNVTRFHWFYTSRFDLTVGLKCEKKKKTHFFVCHNTIELVGHKSKVYDDLMG